MSASKLTRSLTNHKWKTLIGIEVHARVMANSKLFSDASAVFAHGHGIPNSQVSFFDAALPGTLPTVNEACIDQAIMAGVALGGQVQERSLFERKHYFYCDLPLGYQITQQRAPIVTNCVVELGLFGSPGAQNEAKDFSRSIRVSRIQLEQDSGKSIHIEGFGANASASFVDLNRAGLGLMEIVSEPDIHSADEAAQYLKFLQHTLRHIGVCDGNMEEGSFRADVNVSVHNDNDARRDLPLGFSSKRVEVKNLNSIRNVMRAIEFESSRLVEFVEHQVSTGTPLDEIDTVSETRSFDAATGTTALLRRKEDNLDYRFMPEPDLPPLIVTPERVQRVRERLPELPREAYQRLVEGETLRLSPYYATVLIGEEGGVQFFDQVIELLDIDVNPKLAKVVANWMCNALQGHLNARGLTLATSICSPRQLADLISLVQENKINNPVAKQVLKLVVEQGKDPSDIVKENKWEQDTGGDDEIKSIAERIVLSPDFSGELSRYKGGKKGLIGFFVGQVMKQTKGKAPPKLVQQVVKEVLDKQ